MENKMKIIAIGSQKGVGKSTLAKFLVTELRIRNKGLNINQISFADGVKAISYEVYGYLGLGPGVYYENHYDEKETPLSCGLTPRDIWIAVGNKLREIREDCWIQSALYKCSYDIIVIPDLRFKNEAEVLLKYDTCLIKLNRNVSRGSDPAEVDLLDWDNWCMEIDNNGNLQDLYEKAKQIADYLENGRQ